MGSSVREQVAEPSEQLRPRPELLRACDPAIGLKRELKAIRRLLGPARQGGGCRHAVIRVVDLYRAEQLDVEGQEAIWWFFGRVEIRAPVGIRRSEERRV